VLLVRGTTGTDGPRLEVVAALLLSRDGHSFNHQSRAGGGTLELKVIPDFRDVVQHLFEISSDCNLLDTVLI